MGSFRSQICLFVFGTFLVFNTPFCWGNVNAQELSSELAKAYNSGDFDRVESFFSPEALLSPGSFPNVSGSKNIRNFYEFGFTNLDIKMVSFKDLYLELSPDGNRASILGRYVLFGSKGNIIDFGSSIMKLELISGSWKITVDVFNSEQK